MDELVAGRVAENTAQSVIDGLYLFSNCSLGQELTINDFCSDYVNALANGKVFIEYAESRPIGCMTWCFLTEDQARSMTSTGYTPTLEDYQKNDGDQLWVFWTVALDGNGRRLAYQVKRLLNSLYGRRTLFWVRDTDFYVRIHRGHS